MKLLIVLLAVLLGVWLWRSRRPPAKPSKPTQALQEMVPCKVCGLLLPQTEALTTAHGVYCSPAHRAQAEQAPR
ncbi:PP0621 family protein [Rhodoferax sp. WC2427]|uniref:PP0621 family protein n=1 Tax=Rhodoferax sp. WC2427 TaxID=3234144 RepID=UPI003465EC05